MQKGQPLQRRGRLALPVFMAGWFPSELPLQCLATEAVIGKGVEGYVLALQRVARLWDQAPRG